MSHPIEIQELGKAYGNKEVLRGITFDVPQGAVVGFIGDNGAGKTTTFKALLGMIAPDRGTAKLFGEENIAEDPRVKERIGVVFDAMNLPGHLTVRQLVRVFKVLYATWDQAEFNRLLDVFNLPQKQRVDKFSRGMAMKLSLAVALSHHATLLILDEATGGLDPSARDIVLNELRRFVETTRGSIVFSSHIISDIEKIATHLVVIKDGSILLNDTMDNVYKHYAIVEVDASDLSRLRRENIVAQRKLDQRRSKVLVSSKQHLPLGTRAETLELEEMSILLTRSEVS
jgi:ABC-2 type transport system ATP-binding protein